MAVTKSKRAKVLIKNLGSAAGKEIGAADAKSIRGGQYVCPSGQCRKLVVITITTSAGAAKLHKVIIDKTI
jgi:hypothetical protein